MRFADPIRMRSLLPGVLAVVLLCACSRPEPVPLGIVPVDVAYGSLKFTGSIDLFERGEDLEYRARLDATFRSGAEVNRVDTADLTRYFLVATAPGEPGTPSDELSREEESIAVTLTEDGETAPLPEHTFRIPKSVADAAGQVRLAVSDGRIMWPIVDLK
jgi:hypothetical protein